MNNKDEHIPHLPLFGIPAMLPYIKPHTGLIVEIILCMGLAGGIEAVLPLFQNYAINHFVGLGMLDTLGLFIVLFIILILIQGLLQMVGCYAAANCEIYIDRDIRRALFNHVQTLNFSFFSTNSVGYIHSRVISDPNKVGLLVSWVLLDAITSAFYIIVIYIVMFLMSPVLGAILLALVIPMTAVTVFFRKKVVREDRKVREANSIITGNFNEGITGAKTIKSLVIENRIQKDFESDTSRMYSASVRSSRFKALFRAVTMLVSSIALAVVLWKGGMLTDSGLMLVGTLSVFMNYALSLSGHISDLVDTISRLIATQVNIERITKLLEMEPDVTDTPEVINRYGDSFSPKKENWEELNGDIEFRNVSFRYPDAEENDYVLRDFSLKVPKGTMVAIVGETGAGKSTLVNLICRFYEPDSGMVLIDGRDSRERSLLWLHSHIGYVLQTPYLFSGTVRQNLLYGNPDASDVQMEEAVRRVSAEKIIASMENGYDSDVGEGGEKLSTGEKQLLSFARAIIADPRILVLDEATSSVDTLTEKQIQDAIKEVTTGRTSFVIAHRLSTIRSADMIIVMKDGRIIEQGNHRELLSQNGYYSSLYRTQVTENALSRQQKEI